MSVNTSAGNTNDGSVGGGRVWKPNAIFHNKWVMAFAPSVVQLLIVAAFLLAPRNRGVAVNETMTEKLWLSPSNAEANLLGIYILTGCVWVASLILAIMFNKTANFRQLCLGISIPFSIIVLGTVTFLSLPLEESPGQKWAQEVYGYTLAENPQRGQTAILAETSEGVEKTINVVNLNGVIYLTEDHGGIYKMLESEKNR